MNNNTRDEMNSNVVAVFWDFENLHASLYDLKYGERSYQNNRFAAQDILINVKAVMDYVNSFGNVVINKAYANWQYLSRYRNELNEHGLDLIQLFPRGSNMKNSADIRLALDAQEDINRYPYLTHIFIISSDSDYISLAQKVRQTRRTIIGIGVRESTNDYWAKACNEFKFYQTLLSEAANTEIISTNNNHNPIREGEELLLQALKKLIMKRKANKVFKGHLKDAMLKADPTFNEIIYGFSNFSAFLNSFSDKVQIIDSENGGYVGLTQELFEEEFSLNGFSTSKTLLSTRDSVSVALTL